MDIAKRAEKLLQENFEVCYNKSGCREKDEKTKEDARTYSFALKAVKKESPLKVIKEKIVNNVFYCCPQCFVHLKRKSKCCEDCGQALDWSDAPISDFKNEDTCICCGRVIPEGVQVCSECFDKFNIKQ